MKQCLILLVVIGVLGGMTATSIYLADVPEEAMTPLEHWLAYESGMELIAGGLLGLGVLGLVTYAVRRHRLAEAAWTGFAARHGFEREGDRIHGSYRGRPLELKTWVSRSSTGIGSSRQTTSTVFQSMTLGVEGCPAGLQVTRGESDSLRRVANTLSGGLLDAMLSQAASVVSTGDEAFDEAVSVRADDAEQARSWLDERRRAALRELVAREGCRLSADEGLVFSREYRSTSEQELNEALESLGATAEALAR